MCTSGRSAGSAPPVEPLRVLGKHGLLVHRGEVLALQQLVDLVATGLRVEALVGIVAGEQEGAAPRALDRVPQALIVAVESDEDAALAHVALEMLDGALARVRPLDVLPVHRLLDVALVRPPHAIEVEGHPGRPALEEADADPREVVENAVG